MSHYNFKPKATTGSVIPVEYLGNPMEIPAHHQYIALNLMKGPTPSEDKVVVISYAEEPLTTPNGYYTPVPGTDSLILGEVEHIHETRGSLRKVANLSRNEIIINNVEELAYKLLAAVNSGEDADTIIHSVFCPTHGTLPEFHAYTAPSLLDWIEEQHGPEPVEPVPEVEAPIIPMQATAIDDVKITSSRITEQKPRIRLQATVVVLR